MSDYDLRRGKSFAEAEGFEVPDQLNRTVLTPHVRAAVWAFINGYITRWTHSPWDVAEHVVEPASDILLDVYVNFLHAMADEFSTHPTEIKAWARPIFQLDDYLRFFGFLTHLLNNPKFPRSEREILEEALLKSRSAYRLINGDTLCPVSSTEEAHAISQGFEAASAAKLPGAKAHLTAAAKALSSGDFANSVRESVQAIESVARSIESTGELSKALLALEKKGKIHGALKSGFLSIYGFASDEKGIRHPLLDAGDANVSEADAQFMLGAAASFITYLIAKNRK